MTGLIVFGILVFAGSGLLSVCILKSVLKQKKSCACKDCWHQYNGLCYACNPMVDENKKCISFQPSNRYDD